MNKSLFSVVCFLLSFCGTIGGQNDYFLTSTHQHFTDNIHSSYIEIVIEIAVKWELLLLYEYEQDTRIPIDPDVPNIRANAITLEPSMNRIIAIPKQEGLLNSTPIHALSSQNAKLVFVLPKQLTPNITINKRPESFRASYTF